MYVDMYLHIDIYVYMYIHIYIYKSADLFRASSVLGFQKQTCLAKERQAHADDIAGLRADANAGVAAVLRLRIS